AGAASTPITAGASISIAEIAFRRVWCFVVIVTTPSNGSEDQCEDFSNSSRRGGLHPSRSRRIYHHHSPPSAECRVALAVARSHRHPAAARLSYSQTAWMPAKRLRMTELTHPAGFYVGSCCAKRSPIAFNQP